MKSLAAKIAAAFTALAAGGQALAITWGQPDGDAHPQVVALLFEQSLDGDPDNTGLFSCTGTLLNATLVLTAGHCLEGAGVVNKNTWVRSTPNEINLGAELNAFGCVPRTIECIRAYANAMWTPGAAFPHPQFDDYSAFPDTFDVGVVRLSAPIFAPAYGQLPSPGFLNTLLTNKKGAPTERQVRVVGFGSQGTIPAFEQNDFQRYQATATMQQIERNSLVGGQSVQLSNNPGNGTGGGGTCFGDSGGPAFYIDPVTGAETPIVTSVTSFGFSGQCAGRDFNFRMDTATALDFVNGFLP